MAVNPPVFSLSLGVSLLIQGRRSVQQGFSLPLDIPIARRTTVGLGLPL